MSVTNFECQIAKGQIGRYLSGDAFSDEAIRQLESHIAGCPECKAHLAERKKALQSMLGGKPTRAVVEVPESAPAPKPKVKPDAKWAEALAAAGAGVTESPTPTTPRKKEKTTKPVAQAPVAETRKAKVEPVKSAVFTRPLAYALGLAGVLVGMSAFSRYGFDLLGPKATKTISSKPEASPVTTPAPVSATPVPASTPTPTPSAATTPVTNSSTPTPITPAPVASTTPNANTNPVPATPTTTNPPTDVNKKPEATATSVVPPPAPAPPQEHVAEKVAAKPKAPVHRASHRSAPQVHISARRVVSRRTKVRRPRRTVRRSTPHTNSVRVYDAAGNPIN